MEPKPGVKTSELYVAVAVAVAGLLMTYGVLGKDEADAWVRLVEAVVTALIAIVPTLGYIISRYKLKAG